MDLNREFARLVGLCWHEYDTETLNCIHCEKVMWRKDSNNPDYAADPRLVLREMVKRREWNNKMFSREIGIWDCGLIGDEDWKQLDYIMVMAK